MRTKELSYSEQVRSIKQASSKWSKDVKSIHLPHPLPDPRPGTPTPTAPEGRRPGGGAGKTTPAPHHLFKNAAEGRLFLLVEAMILCPLHLNCTKLILKVKTASAKMQFVCCLVKDPKSLRVSNS